MIIMGIDPGPDKSAYVILDCENMTIRRFGHEDNEAVLVVVEESAVDDLAIENVSYYGPKTSIGATTLDTARWVGRFEDRRATSGKHPPTVLIKNQKVRACMCGQVSVKKSAVHQAAKDRFPRTGGGSSPQKGTKKQPGPLYGMSGPHIFDALAIALTLKETREVAQ